MPVHCIPPTWVPTAFHSNVPGDNFMFTCAATYCPETPPLGRDLSIPGSGHCPPGYAACDDAFGASRCFPIHCPVPSSCGLGGGVFLRNCFYLGVPGFIFCPQEIDCELATCPSGYTFDPVSRYCCENSGGPCPPGTCWCATSNRCVNCSFGQTCPGVATNIWDPVACRWVATPPDCGPTSYFDWGTCACVPCPPHTCHCEPTNACVPCTNGMTPKCSAGRGCVWNRFRCQWDCTTPTCPPGQVYDLEVCRCIPVCPPGQCWCETPSPGACISCTPPTCAEALHCAWNADTCLWHCDDPATVCGAGRVFNMTTCQCPHIQDLWLLRDTRGRLHRWGVNAGGQLVQDLFGDGDSTPTTTVVDPAADCSCPTFHLIEDWIWGVHLRGTTPILSHSRNYGGDYTMVPIPGDYETAVSLPHLGNRVLLFGFKAGAWYLRVILIGDNAVPTPSAEVALTPALPHTPNGVAAAWCEDSGTVVFSWGDTTGNTHLSRTGVISDAAVATWRHT